MPDELAFFCVEDALLVSLNVVIAAVDAVGSAHGSGSRLKRPTALVNQSAREANQKLREAPIDDARRMICSDTNIICH